MKVNTRLVIWKMQTTEKSRHDVDTVIFYRGLGKLANFPLLLVVAIHPLDVSQANGRCQIPQWELARNTHKMGIHKPHSTSVALRDLPRGEHEPLIMLLWSTAQSPWRASRSLLPPSHLGGGNLQE